jgi:HEPN domain-containing protein
MTLDEKVQYWKELSDYDLETAEAMLHTARYLYVGFTCHQVIEKIFKACFTKRKEETPPFTHDLQYLAEKAGFWASLSETQKDFINALEPLNIKTRYPDYKRELVKRLTAVKCSEILKQTQSLQQWIKEKLL